MFDLRLEYIAKWVRDGGYASVALQLPEGLKVRATEVVDFRTRETGVDCVILGEPCYGACDLFVLSSVMKTEAFGIVQIEAFSCGKPVVATTIPGSGVSWVNQDGVSGRNVPPGDSRALASAIEEVMAQYPAFSEGARKRFETCFREESMIQSLFQL